MFLPVGMADRDGVHPSENVGRAENQRHGVHVVSYAVASRHQARIRRLARVGRYVGDCPLEGKTGRKIISVIRSRTIGENCAVVGEKF